MSPLSYIDEKVIYEILKNLTTKPEAIQIVRALDDQGVLISIKVDSSDMGIVIGKAGSMAIALKTVAKAIGKANGINLRLIFEEPEGSTKRNDLEVKPPVPVSNIKQNLNDSSQSQEFDHDLDDLVIN